MTYNKYLTEGIQDGTIKEIEQCGVRCYVVRRPEPNEEVMGYSPLSAVSFYKTPTETAEVQDEG